MNISLLNFLWNTIHDVGLILRFSTDKNKKRLLRAKLMIEFDQFLPHKRSDPIIYDRHLLGYHIHFFDYRSILFLLQEIFINQEYYFCSKEKKPVIIDCGSNIGMSILYFKKIYPDAKITAFEPDKKTFRLLTNNVVGNGLQDVELFNCAISDHEGHVNFYSDPDNSGSLVMSLKEERMAGAIDKVKCVKLSGFINAHVDFLKMDIEGEELSVMKELSRENRLGYIGEMIIEYHHHIKRGDDTISEMLKLLESHNFSYQLSSSLITPFEKDIFQDILIYAYQRNKEPA